MIVHTKTNPENLRLRMAGKLLLTAMFFWIWSVPLTLAQTGGLGCLVDAGISPQEVCIEDHVFLGGTPTIPSALAGEVSSIQWSVVSPDIDVEFSPNAEVPNPQVYVTQPTTFEVALVLTDGSSCSSQITLIPIEEPSLDLQGSWTQCDGSTQLWFYNTAPSNSVDVTYDVFWGDGEVSLDLTFASAFEHEYDAQGGYNVTVNAELGFCSNVEHLDVFLGSPPDPIILDIPEVACFGGNVEFEWSNLNDYPLGSAWGIAMDGELQFAGEVTMETVNNFAWSFGQVESCAEALASHSILVDIENECSPPASLLQEVVVNEEPVADFALAADSCAVVQFTLGEDVFCPDLFDVLWSISEIEGSVEPETLAGSASSNFWTTSLLPGEYAASLQVGSEACGYDMDTVSFCVEMPPPLTWGTGLLNGGQFNICQGETLEIWADSLSSVCGEAIQTQWTLSALNGQTDLSSVIWIEEYPWSHAWTFPSPGTFLVQLDGSGGCGELNLYAQIVVTNLPSVELVSFDMGAALDSVMCAGDELSVVAEVSGLGLNSGAYNLEWNVLDDENNPHPSATSSMFGDSTLVVASSFTEPAMDLVVTLEVGTACGNVTDTLWIEVEEPIVPSFLLQEGSPGNMSSEVPEFLQCMGDTLAIEFQVEGALQANALSNAPDLYDVAFDESTGQGTMLWLANGDSVDLAIEFVSSAGCASFDSISFRSLSPPQVFVDDADIVCLGDPSIFNAVVFPGSTNDMSNYAWSMGNTNLQGGPVPQLSQVMEDCYNNAPVEVLVTDAFGCQASTSALAPVSCPSSVSHTSLTCAEIGELACVTWTPNEATGWNVPDNLILSDFGTTTCVEIDMEPELLNFSWTEYTSLGCAQIHHACWAIGPVNPNGECTVPGCIPPPPPPPPPCDSFTCLEPEACNYEIESCCLDSCTYPEHLSATDLPYDTLEFCQSFTFDFPLEANEPWIGNWSGPSVLDYSSAQCPGTQAALDLSEFGEWDIYFSGGIGSCIDVDTVHVVVHRLPTYSGPSSFAECHGTALPLGNFTSGNPDYCWSLNWLGESSAPCDSSGLWTVDGSGYVSWSATDVHGCTSLNTSIYVVDLGGPNAYAGNDTVLCSLPVPNAMEFEFGTPYALGCGPAEGNWSGEGGSYEVFAEVWTAGNCVQNSAPWTDSLWTFTAPDTGSFEWIWTVVDCHGCMAQDTLNIDVVEPIQPQLPPLTYCVNDTLGPVTSQEEACWFGAGISPDNWFDPAVAGVGIHEWIVGLGEGSCAVNDTIIVEVFDDPKYDLSGMGVMPCFGETFTLCADNYDTDDFPWTYAWSAFPPLPGVDSCNASCCSIQDVDATAVSVLITNVHGCSTEDSWIINLADSPEVIVEDTLELCQDGAWHPLLSEPIGGVWEGPWVDPDGAFLAEEIGTFNLTYTFTNDQNCTDTDTTIVVVSDIPVPKIDTPDSWLCLGTPLTLDTEDEGIWSGPGISADGSVFQNEPGTYTYVLTAGSGSCLAHDSVDITFWPNPEFELPSLDTVLCAGEPIVLELDSAMLTAQNIVVGSAFGCDGLTGGFPLFSFSPEETCDFSVSIQDANGCTASDAMTVIVPLPVPSYAGPPEVLCIGETLTLTGQIVPSCATDVIWEGDVVNEVGVVTADVIGPHTLQLSYIDCYGCGVSGTRDVLVLDVPDVAFWWEDSVACADQEVDAYVEGYGGSLSYEWLWYDGSVLPVPDTPWVAVNPGTTPLEWSMAAVAFNLCGSDTAWANIEVNPTLLISPSSALSPTPLLDDTLCAPLSLEFLAEAPGASTWVWADVMTVDSLNANSAWFEVEHVEQPTNFSLSVQAGLGETMCSTPLQWNLMVVPGPLAEILGEEFAYCGEEFDPGIDFEVDHGLPAWNWSGGDLPPGFPEVWNISDIGLTTLSLTASSVYPGVECTATDEVTLSLFPQPSANVDLLSDSVLCAPGMLMAQDLSESASEIYWNMAYNSGWSDPGSELNVSIPVAGTYDLTWAAIGEEGCNDTLHVQEALRILPSPEAGIWAGQSTSVTWTPEGTNFVFGDASFGSDSIVWSIGDSTLVNQNVLSVFYDDPGMYGVFQEVHNEYGCQDSITLRFEIAEELAIYVPTAFTPNQDALNEVWKPVISGVQRIDQYHLQVFSRWGQLVFETSVPGEGWDALNVPRPDVLENSQNSVFAYLINILPDVTVNEPDPDWIELRGHVTIVD
ncbi:MAG: gliding motility-associated C-terminal domain-containing protein [Flavobacteriales bacterium]